MGEKSKVFMLIPTEKQMETISAWCFKADKCGAVYFCGLEMEGEDEKGEPIFVVGFPCPRSDCPVVEKEMDEPVGEVEGDLVYIRKLKEDLVVIVVDELHDFKTEGLEDDGEKSKLEI